MRTWLAFIRSGRSPGDAVNEAVHPAVLLRDVSSALADLETTFAEWQKWDELQSFNTRQRVEFHEALTELRELIQHLSSNPGEEQMAS